MSGIAGILKKDYHSQVEKMLDKISHRGKKGRKIINLPKATLGLIWSD
jgi:asparagine synthetase B (glutamine-hydrolysing)